MAHLKITRDFDYRWPSRSVTAYKAGPDTLVVRREVADYAVAHKVGVDMDGEKKDAK